MIITLIFAAILLIGIALLKFTTSLDDFWLGVITVVGAIGTVMCIIIVISVHVTSEIDYRNNVRMRQDLMYRQTLKSDSVGNELLLREITEFNQDLERIKYWHNNPWVNWFYNGKIAQIEYIEYSKGEDTNEQNG